MSALADLIRRARRRHLLHLLADRTSFAAALALGGCIVLLVIGTQILDWYWPVLLFAAGFAISAWRGRSSVRSPYQLAQAIDSRLELHDALSTALFFNNARGEIVERQRAIADELAGTADLRRALPFAAPRALHVSGALTLVALSLFGVRYGITRTLDLRAALIPLSFEGAPDRIDQTTARNRRPPGHSGQRLKELNLPDDPWEAPPVDKNGPPDAVLNTIDTPDPNNPDVNTEASAKSKASGGQSPQDPQAPGDTPDGGERSASSKDQASENASAQSSEGGARNGQTPKSQDSKQGGDSSENSSLGDKMRDALANLLSKLKMQSKPGEGKQEPSPSQSASESAKQNQGRDKDGAQQEGRPNGEGAANADPKGDQKGENGERAEASAKNGGKSANRPGGSDSKSGVGKQDGDKTAREAEQLAAMGKISEIIGKRSANMTGEVMVEVASGKQQLRTQYTNRKANHIEAGGDINRDEVPLAYQQYVQQYFEEIRKPARVKAEAAKKPGL